MVRRRSPSRMRSFCGQSGELGVQVSYLVRQRAALHLHCRSLLSIFERRRCRDSVAASVGILVPKRSNLQVHPPEFRTLALPACLGASVSRRRQFAWTVLPTSRARLCTLAALEILTRTPRLCTISTAASAGLPASGGTVATVL